MKSPVFNWLARLAAGGDFADTQCGFKLYRQDVAKDIFSRMTIDGFAFDVEALYLARRLGYRVCEEPVTWANDGSTKVNPLLDPLRMARDVVRMRLIRREP